MSTMISHFNCPSSEEDQLHRINLQALQNVDPHITKILDQAQRVCVYKFLAEKREWERKDLEGTLFVFERSSEPYHGFVILSTTSRETFVQIIKASLEFKHSPNHEAFLQYKVDVGDIYGIWFISKDDCPRVTECLERLTVKAQESDPSRVFPTFPQNSSNIFSILTKAQDKFHESKRKQESNHAETSINMPTALQRLFFTRDFPTSNDERERELKKTLGILGKPTLSVTELEQQLLKPTTLITNKSSARTSPRLILPSHIAIPVDGWTISHQKHNDRLMAPDSTPPCCHCQTEQNRSIHRFSKDTLRQLLIDMLQNDDEFLAAIHNALREKQNGYH